MKYILVAVLVHLTNPSEPSLLAHRSFDSLEQCEATIRKLPTPPSQTKLAAFCVAQDDLLEIEQS